MYLFEIQPSFAIQVSVFCLVGVVVYAISNFVDPYRFGARQRLKRLGKAQWGQSDDQFDADRKRTSLPIIRHLLAPFRFGTDRKIDERLVMAGIHRPSVLAALVPIRMALTLLPIAIFAWLIHHNHVALNMGLLMIVWAAGSGWLIPELWLRQKITQYRTLMHTSLPDFLDLMIVCLDAGLSLQEGVRRVTAELKDIHPALASELAIVQRDVELGSSFDQALKRFANRVQCDSVGTLSSLLRESQRHGTQITEALRGHAESLRYRREQKAEEKAQKASVKIILPMMLCIFPGIFIVLVAPAAMQIQQAFSGAN